MKIKTLLLIGITCFITSCKFNQSSHTDLRTGLSTRGNGLSCEQVYLSDTNNKEITTNQFMYGQTFFLNFQEIDGFEEKEEHKFIGVSMLVTNKSGDTILNYKDLYEKYTNGINISPLLVKTNLTIAEPMHSNKSYKLDVHIWDKKGTGTFDAELNFNVVPNEQIVIEKNNITYDEIYLFSEKKTLITNTINFDENNYLIFKGLKGFKEENGKVFPGVSMIIKDANGKLILNEQDIMKNPNMTLAELTSGFYPNFKINNGNVKNPINCELLIWDKKSDHKIKASMKLNVQ